MADDEKLNSDIFEGIFREVVEEEWKDPVRKTKNLLSFMMSGKETFNAVLESFRRAKVVEFIASTVDKERQIDCHIGIWNCDESSLFYQHFRNLPDILIRNLLSYSKSITFYNTNVGFGRRLACLKDNKRLETIGFDSHFDTRATQAVLRNIKCVDKIEGSARTLRAVAAMKLDVTTIHVKEFMKLSYPFVFHDYYVTTVSPEFTGLKNLDIICNVGDRRVLFVALICQFERYMDQFDTLVKKYEIDFPDLQNLTFHIAADISDFFKETPYAYNKLFEQISIIENNLRTYTGRLKITFDCILEFYEDGEVMYNWSDEIKSKLPGYVFKETTTEWRTSFEYSKTAQLLPNVELKMTVRTCSDNEY